MPGVEWALFSSAMRLVAMGRTAPLTHFSSSALSSQEPALTLRKNPEDKLGQGLLEARSEVSGCLFFLLNISLFIKGVGTFLLPRIFKSFKDHLSPSPNLGCLLSRP